MTTEAKKVAPAGDTPRRQADAINMLADYANTGQLQERTVAQLSATDEKVKGRMYLCTDETGGAVPAFCPADGQSFRRVTDRAVVS